MFVCSQQADFSVRLQVHFPPTGNETPVRRVETRPDHDSDVLRVLFGFEEGTLFRPLDLGDEGNNTIAVEKPFDSRHSVFSVKC